MKKNQLKSDGNTEKKKMAIEDFLLENLTGEVPTIKYFYDTLYQNGQIEKDVIEERSIFTYILSPYKESWLKSYLEGVKNKKQVLNVQRMRMLKKVYQDTQNIVVDGDGLHPIHSAFLNDEIGVKEFREIAIVLSGIDQESLSVRDMDRMLELWIKNVTDEVKGDKFTKGFVEKVEEMSGKDLEKSNTSDINTRLNSPLFQKYMMLTDWMRNSDMPKEYIIRVFMVILECGSNLKKKYQEIGLGSIYHRVKFTSLKIKGMAGWDIQSVLSYKDGCLWLKRLDQSSELEKKVSQMGELYRTKKIQNAAAEDILYTLKVHGSQGQDIMPFAEPEQVIGALLDIHTIRSLVEWYYSNENTSIEKQPLVNQSGERNKDCWIVENFGTSLDRFLKERARSVIGLNKWHAVITDEGEIRQGITKKKGLAGLTVAECYSYGLRNGRKGGEFFRERPTEDQFKGYVDRYYQDQPDCTVGLIDNRGRKNIACWLVDKYPGYMDPLLSYREKLVDRLNKREGLGAIVGRDGNLRADIIENNSLRGIDVNECAYYGYYPGIKEKSTPKRGEAVLMGNQSMLLRGVAQGARGDPERYNQDTRMVIADEFSNEAWEAVRILQNMSPSNSAEESKKTEERVVSDEHRLQHYESDLENEASNKKRKNVTFQDIEERTENEHLSKKRKP